MEEIFSTKFGRWWPRMAPVSSNGEMPLDSETFASPQARQPAITYKNFTQAEDVLGKALPDWYRSDTAGKVAQATIHVPDSLCMRNKDLPAFTPESAAEGAAALGPDLQLAHKPPAGFVMSAKPRIDKTGCVRGIIFEQRIAGGQP